MEVRVLKAALRDLKRGEHFYNLQDCGVGEYFMNSLIQDIDKLEYTGGSHRITYKHHRALSQKFPYAIFYTVANDVVLVRRILDCRESPESTFRKLGD